GRPASEICGHFKPLNEQISQERGLSTGCQVCKWCDKDIVDLVDHSSSMPTVASSSQSDEHKILQPKRTCTQPIDTFLDHITQNDEYEKKRNNLNEMLENANNITLISDGWSNIRGESVLNFILCLPQPIFYDAHYTGAESHTAEFIYGKLKSVIEDIEPSKFAVIITDNATGAILQQEPNTIALVKPVDTCWVTSTIKRNLKDKILGEELWSELEKQNVF
ncbi:6459_t:CDS:2, partial [Ambispora gerdemannii]